jgi:SAM-dependent methyltransferase
MPALGNRQGAYQMNPAIFRLYPVHVMGENDWQSLAWKSRLRIGRYLLGSAPSTFAEDDFNWGRYHLEYEQQLRNLEAHHNLRLQPGEATWNESGIEGSSAALLHGNHELLYTTVLGLRPCSVLEAGCGGGDHLHNLLLLDPNLRVAGVDRSKEQIDTLVRRNPELADLVRAVDLTLPVPSDIATSSLVYTQAVIMHIQTGNGHRVALANLFRLAEDYVVLVENWERHNFLSDIAELHAVGVLGWPELHLYWRTRPWQGLTLRALIASRVPITWDLPGMERVATLTS